MVQLLSINYSTTDLSAAQNIITTKIFLSQRILQRSNTIDLYCTRMKINQYAKNVLISIPFLIAIPLLFVLLGKLLGIHINLPLVGLGALGWYLALLLRFPFIFLFQKTVPAKSQLLTVLLSGPTEELTRLVCILLAVTTAPGAYSLGLGWASIEIVYSVVQGFAVAKLSGGNDKKTLKVRVMIKQIGMDAILKPENVFWGILERISVSAGHIAFSLLIFWNPLSVLVTIPIHSIVNKTALELQKKSLLKTELFVGIVFLFLFVLSLRVNGLL